MTWKNWSTKERSKFVLRSLLAPHLTYQYIRTLATLTQHAYLDNNKYLLGKLHRPYLATHLSKQQAYDIIIYHHHYLARHLPLHLLACLYQHRLTLCYFKGKSESFAIVLSTESHFNKEGEITLSLYANQSAIRLMSLTCSIACKNDQPYIIIGGLQGGAVEHSNVIKEATKQCYGLFPKRILFEALQIIAQSLGITHIQGVCNKHHIYKSRRYYNRKSQAFVADYDKFWLEMQGKPTKFWYYFTTQIKQKPLEEIPSKKRAQYKHRYQLQSKINTKIDNIIKQYIQLR